ncbi:hypothetical protein RhiirA4_398145 [Rhizophagus irregularis]|uniref:Uncharacterized protein n=1 Tax=Rhizophagus irregularis TaxID=588596 RepID=A0A2I1G8J7_9GLOM|nr:hypothetical protein RhiirA4_398145 [Rhizophagus irregularis]
MSELELTENMNELEQRLSTLKRWFDMGYITEELHNEYSRRVLNDWFKRPDDEKPFWKRILDKAISLGHTVLAVLVSIFVRPSQITDE